MRNRDYWTILCFNLFENFSKLLYNTYRYTLVIVFCFWPSDIFRQKVFFSNFFSRCIEGMRFIKSHIVQIKILVSWQIFLAFSEPQISLHLRGLCQINAFSRGKVRDSTLEFKCVHVTLSTVFVTDYRFDSRFS